MPPKPRYIDGEKVLCFHGPLLYEAKCLKSQLHDKHMQYFIHYSGWNKNWDEWVPESRVLKYNDVNLQKQKELIKTHMKSKKAKSAKMTVKSKESEKESSSQVSPGEKSKLKAEKIPTPSPVPDSSSISESPNEIKKKKKPESCPPSESPSEIKKKKKLESGPPSESPSEIKKKKKLESGPPSESPSEIKKKKKLESCPPSESPSEIKKKKKLESLPSSESPGEIKKKIKVEVTFEEEIEPEREIRLNFPSLLKEWLVDDNDLIARQKKLLRLPARITVDHIIAGFVKEKVSVKGLTQSMERNIVLFANNVRDFFNVSLGKMLLHKFERPQYGEMLAEYPDWRMCQIYGTIHLLRLFTMMGDMLTNLPMRGDKMSSLVIQLEDFMRYISENPSFFSLKDYEVASPEYHRRAL